MSEKEVLKHLEGMGKLSRFRNNVFGPESDICYLTLNTFWKDSELTGDVIIHCVNTFEEREALIRELSEFKTDVLEKMGSLIAYLEMWAEGKPRPMELRNLADEAIEWHKNQNEKMIQEHGHEAKEFEL